MTLGPDMRGRTGSRPWWRPGQHAAGPARAGREGRPRPQEGGQLGGGQAQLFDEAKVLQRGERDSLQRPPARQPRDLKHIKAVPVLQLRAARGAARSRRGPATAP